MKLSEYKRKSDEYTSKASDIVRQMLLGAIGLVWVFKETENGIGRIDQFLFYPLLTVSFGLVFDLLQYVIAGKIWKDFFISNEKTIRDSTTSNPYVKAPRKLNRVIYFFYWGKILLMVVTYMLIIHYLWSRINLM
jgi:hypothetical protein